MLTSTPKLQIFIEPAPTVAQTANLASVLAVFSPTQDRVVVVNAAWEPVGIVHLRSLTPYLLAGLATQRNSDSTETRTSTNTGLDLQQPLYATGPPLLEPLPSLRADLNLNQLWPHLLEDIDSGRVPLGIPHPEPSNFFAVKETQCKQDWAIVSPTGEFLGLLDRCRLLEFLAIQSVAQQQPAASALSSKFFAAKQNFGQGTDVPTERLYEEKSELPSLERLHALIETFDLLPLPLCLETSNGTIIARNQAFCRHFKDSTTLIQPQSKTAETDNPNYEISEQSASVLTPKACDCQATSKPLEKLEISRDVPSERLYEEKQTASQFPIANKEELEIKSFELGEKQTACQFPISNSQFPCTDVPTERLYGVCLIPSDSEKVWQFVKMPIDIAVPVQYSETEEAETATGELYPNHNSVTKPNTNKPIETVWLVLAQDVSEYQQVAKELAAKNADLVQLNRLKDDFLACISHELKTPLTAVLGLSSLLKDQTIGQLNERQARYARLIYQSGRHLMAVVNDILDLTRMESGQMELLVEPVSVSSVCERAIHSAWHLQPAEKGQEEQMASDAYQNDLPPGFTLSIEPNLEIMVADELRLRQMLVNLLSNAFKFTEPSGKVGLKVSRWEGWIAFTVWDTGIGIPDDKQHLIFQKFQQLENPLIRRFEGVGLGLVVARGLARLHGGDVTFISSEGKGSEFTLLLPPQPPEQNSTPRKTSEPRHRLVLIVEAVPRFIEQLSSQLTSLGYRVVIARTGTEALDKARRFSPEVIFLNPVLPMLSGWDVLTLLKSDAVTRNIPTVIAATQAEKDQAFRLRADGFLSLPVQLGALRGVLQKLGSQNLPKPTKLTVLRLNIRFGNLQPATEDLSTVEPLNALLHQYDYRVLEAEDLEGAEMLARVWQPDVVLLDSADGFEDGVETFRRNVCTFFEKYSQNCSRLASLPLVTFDRLTTQAASLVPGLAVFPCLGELGVDRDVPPERLYCPLPEVLLAVIEQAAGKNSFPVICVVDFSVLPDLAKNRVSCVDSRNDWCQALFQYIQTAGYRGLIGQSWGEVWQQLETKSIDLLLINFRHWVGEPAVVEALTALRNLPEKPPILVVFQPSTSNAKLPLSQPFFGKGEVDQGWRNVAIATAIKQQESFVNPSGLNNVITSDLWQSEQIFIEGVLKELATKVCSGSLSMAELLEEIHSILKAH